MKSRDITYKRFALVKKMCVGDMIHVSRSRVELLRLVCKISTINIKMSSPKVVASLPLSLDVSIGSLGSLAASIPVNVVLLFVLASSTAAAELLQQVGSARQKDEQSAT